MNVGLGLTECSIVFVFAKRWNKNILLVHSDIRSWLCVILFPLNTHRHLPHTLWLLSLRAACIGKGLPQLCKGHSHTHTHTTCMSGGGKWGMRRTDEMGGKVSLMLMRTLGGNWTLWKVTCVGWKSNVWRNDDIASILQPRYTLQLPRPRNP